MKAVSILNRQITHMQFDSRTSKGLNITPSDEKKIERGEQEKEKKTGIPFDYFISDFYFTLEEKTLQQGEIS